MDLYALGLLAYEMLTGHVPFKEDSPQKTMAAQLTREPEPITNSRADVPEALTRLTSRLLAKQPEDRPQVAAEVVTILDDIAMSSGQTLAPLRPVSKPSFLRIGGVIAAGAAVVAVAWAAGERQGTEQASTFVRDSLAAAETAQVVPQASAFLTREDSMAIAKAVAERMQQRMPTAAPATAPAPATGAAGKVAGTGATVTATGDLARAVIAADSVRLVVMADSIRALIQREVLDSIVMLSSRLGPNAVRLGAASKELALATEAAATATAAAAPQRQVQFVSPRGEPRRVVVAMPRPSRDRPDLDIVGRTLADSLRVGIDKHPRYVVVPADSVAMALRESRTVNAVQEKLKADLIVSISLRPVGDSVERIISIRDLAAPQGSNNRVLISGASAKAPAAATQEIVPEVLRLMFDIERARFRPPTSTMPGQAFGPTGPTGAEGDPNRRGGTRPPPPIPPDR
jgi:hypothetical protein